MMNPHANQDGNLSVDVIPGHAEGVSPESTQYHQSLSLDSGFADCRPRPGVTAE